jgi:hypothetical protein
MGVLLFHHLALRAGPADSSVLPYLGGGWINMLSNRQRKAVRLLFEMPDDQVAEELGIQTRTLRRWKGQREFIEAVVGKGRESQESIRRIASNVVIHGATRLREALVMEDRKADLKVLCDLVKSTGVLADILKSEEGGEELHVLLDRIAAEPDPAEESV